MFCKVQRRDVSVLHVYSLSLLDIIQSFLEHLLCCLSPGLMITSAVLYHILHFFHITIDIRNVCVFLAPLFSSFTAIVTYHFTKELKVKYIIRYMTSYFKVKLRKSYIAAFFVPAPKKLNPTFLKMYSVVSYIKPLCMINAHIC